MCVRAFNVALRPQTIMTIRDGEPVQDVHLDFHTAPELWSFPLFSS